MPVPPMTKRLLALLVLVVLSATTSCIDKVLGPDDVVVQLKLVSGGD